MSVRLGVAAAVTAVVTGATPPASYVLRTGPGDRLQLATWRVDRKPTYAAGSS